MDEEQTVTDQGVGCRDVTFAGALLLGAASALFATGLTLVNGDCSAGCETLALTALYAGGPFSAAWGVLTESIAVAWPLDVIVWVVLAFWAARTAQRRGTSALQVAFYLLLGAVGYGLVLSQLVELAV